MIKLVNSGQEEAAMIRDQLVVGGLVRGMGRGRPDCFDVAVPFIKRHGREFFTYAGAPHQPVSAAVTTLTTSIVGVASILVASRSVNYENGWELGRVLCKASVFTGFFLVTSLLLGASSFWRKNISHSSSFSSLFFSGGGRRFNLSAHDLSYWLRYLITWNFGVTLI